MARPSAAQTADRSTTTVMQGIPAGFEDFVRSHHDLLAQFQDMSDVSRDEVTYTIYQLGLEKLSQNEQVHAIMELRKRIQCFIDDEITKYQWNLGKFALYIVLSESSPYHLKGVVEFGNNVEDEWYVVYILQKVSLSISNIAISVWDNDGQFLLIEAADHIDAWLGPENSEHRIWIHQGKIHVIPIDAPGRTSTGVRLHAALSHLSQDPRSSIASPSLQSTICSRTLEVYPAKAAAHQHYLACILPYWAALLFEKYPHLVSMSINEFGLVDGEELSKAVAGTKPQVLNPLSPALVARSIRMTRTLYAQLSFKKFKIPRRFHHLMRLVSTANSAKVMKAFDFGCRLASGLLLVLNRQSQDRKERERSLHLKRQLVAQQLRTLGLDGEHFLSEPFVVDNSDDSDDNAELFKDPSQDVVDAFNAIHSSLLTCESAYETEIHRSSVWEDILRGRVKNDSEEWMYLDPEKLDEEMKSRMKEFALDSQKTSSSQPNNAENHINANINTNANASNNVRADDEIQEMAEGFRHFLSQKSDYEGITTKPKAKKVQLHQDDVENTTIDLSKMSLDVAYIDSLVQSTLGDLQQEAVVDQGIEINVQQPPQSMAGIIGTSFVELAPGNSAIEVEDADSDDEDDFNAEEASSGSEDNSVDGDSDEVSESDSMDPTESNEFETYQREMDQELFQENALRETFAELQKWRQEAGIPDNDDEQVFFGPADMDEEEMDLHLMSNLLQSHAEGMGMPQGPVHALLSQLGISLPKVPSTHSP